MKKAILFGATNQVISSGTTFGLTVFLINQISQIEFGIYALTFASALFFTGLGNALILLNFSIKLGTIQQEKQPNLIERTIRSILIYGTLATTLTTLSAITGKLLSNSNSTLQYNAIILGLTIGCYITLTLIKDLQTRTFYANHCESKVLTATTIYSAIIFASIIITATAGIKIVTDVTSALLLQCAALSIAILTGRRSLGKSTFKTDTKKTIIQFRRDILNGADAGKANIINWIRSYGFNWMTGIWGGPVAVAQINASRLLITPPTLILPAIGQPLLAHLSRGLHQGKARTVSAATKFINVTLVLMFLYSMPMLLYHDYIVKMVFGEEYTGTKSLTYLWIAFALFSSISTISTITLQALKQFDFLKKNAIFSLAILLITAYPLYKVYDISGILAAVVLSEAFAALRSMGKAKKESKSPQHEKN